MSKAELVRTGVFLLWGVAAILVYFTLRPTWLGLAGFLVVGLFGSWLASRLHVRIAVPEEKRRDLEDRVRNPDF